MRTVRWNIAVSADTDQSVRLFLASQGGGRKGDLSRFIEEAVRAHILELTAAQAKAANERLSGEDLTTIVKEAVQWARNRSCAFSSTNCAGPAAIQNFRRCCDRTGWA